jgi:hypothetical protein
MAHQITNLTWAARATSPWPKPRGRRGTKALGLRYERSVAKALGTKVEHNPWFQFRDGTHQGYCSPDLLLEDFPKNMALVLEVKLTNWRSAWDQLELLYLPVLTLALGVRTVIPVVVVKHLSPGVVVAHTLREAIQRRAEHPVLHWLGHSPFPLG